MSGVLRIKNTERWVLLDFEEDLKERFFREEEEPETRRVGWGEVGGDGYGRHGYGNTARVSEAEFLEEDHGS